MSEHMQAYEHAYSPIMAHICGRCIWKLKLALVIFLKQSPLILRGKGSLEADLVVLVVEPVKFPPEFQLCPLTTGVTVATLPDICMDDGDPKPGLNSYRASIYSLCHLHNLHLSYFEMMSTLVCSF